MHLGRIRLVYIARVMRVSNKFPITILTGTRRYDRRRLIGHKRTIAANESTANQEQVANRYTIRSTEYTVSACIAFTITTSEHSNYFAQSSSMLSLLICSSSACAHVCIDRRWRSGSHCGPATTEITCKRMIKNAKKRRPNILRTIHFLNTSIRLATAAVLAAVNASHSTEDRQICYFLPTKVVRINTCCVPSSCANPATSECACTMHKRMSTNISIIEHMNRREIGNHTQSVSVNMLDNLHISSLLRLRIFV